jgi:hypothetical protein
MNPPHNTSVDAYETDPADAPLSISHFVRTIRNYAQVILLAMAGVALAYVIVALAIYLRAPVQRVTQQPFRLDFEGAAQGTYPNGLRFSPVEIVSTPVLLDVYRSNHLERFASFGEFSRSVFILETNRAYEKLVADYQARIADNKLTPIERDRLQKEFDLKSASISKNEYSVSFAPMTPSTKLPASLTKKVLLDILNRWSTYAIDEQHALGYRVSVLSPRILDDAFIMHDDVVIATQVLRSKVDHILANIGQIESIPGSELVRTSDGMSLQEIRIRLEDQMRFRLEPLMRSARSSGLLTNTEGTIQFLRNQLAYDQRKLKAILDRADTARNALLVYTAEKPMPEPDAATRTEAMQPPGDRSGRATEGITAQINDTFLDRLVSLSSRSIDSEYRQRLVDEYRGALRDAIPVKQAVDYDTYILQDFTQGPARGNLLDRATAVHELIASRDDIRKLIVKVNDIYTAVSHNLSPQTQLMTITGPPISRAERTRSLADFALYGLLVLLVALPVIIVLCLIHNRIREEESAAAEGVLVADERTAP